MPNHPVLLWNDFLTKAFSESSSLDAKKRIFKRPDLLDLLDEFLISENTVVNMFLSITKAVNNQRLKYLRPSPEFWGTPCMFSAIKGQPDAIHCSFDNINLLKRGEASKILGIVEIKTDQLISSLLDEKLDLCEAYNKASTIKDDKTTKFTKYKKIINVVRQTFGYMVANDLQYGLLTTFIRTWFFYRDSKNPDILYISSAVRID